jgi:hypothetical protein
MSPWIAWPWLAISVVTFTLALNAGEWVWAVITGLFTFSASGILWRYYTFGRHAR